MCLQADTIDLSAILLYELDDPLCTCGLGTGPFEVVVVVVELDIWVCGSCSCKRDRKICLADDLVEDAVTISTVLVKS